MLPAASSPTETGIEDLRKAFHALIRRFGLLETAHTPCGQPIPISSAHALMELLASSPLRQGQLGEALGLSKSATSRLVAQLEQRGWLDRTADGLDGRVWQLTLTPGGRRIAHRLNEASLARFSVIFRHLPKKERSRAVTTLNQLTTAIGMQHEGERAW